MNTNAPRSRILSNWIVLGVCVFLLGMLLPALAINRATELANRVSCATNIRFILQSMVVYSQENSDAFPCYVSASDTTYKANLKGKPGEATSDNTLAALYKSGANDNNVFAGAWIMVLNGQVEPKNFICPSDPFAGVPAKIMLNGASYATNFQSSKNVSYSFAYPWAAGKNGAIGPAPWWQNPEDSSIPCISDAAPYLSTKAKPGEVTTRPQSAPVATTSPDDPMVLNDGTNFAAPAFQSSPNHAFQGQNVGFGDAHVEFTLRADVGQANDNIWTEVVKGGGEKTIDAGTLHEPLRTKEPYDIVMVPMRSAKGDWK